MKCSVNSGWTEKAKLTGKFNDLDAQQFIIETRESNPDIVVYNFKYFPSPDRTGFDFNPRLIREVVKFNSKKQEMGEAELIFRSSEHDPWADGFLTNFCVESSCRTAYDRGYGVTVIKDATATNSEEEQNHSEQKIFPLLGQTLSVDQFISQLEE